jgi:hypothetical protein
MPDARRLGGLAATARAQGGKMGGMNPVLMRRAREVLQDAGYQARRAPSWGALAAQIAGSDYHRSVRAALGLPAAVALGYVGRFGYGDDDHVARYIDGTASIVEVPMVVAFNVRALDAYRKKVSPAMFEDELSVTLLHEYGHAFIATAFDASERPLDDVEERLVEELARRLVGYDERALADFLRRLGVPERAVSEAMVMFEMRDEYGDKMFTPPACKG